MAFHTAVWVDNYFDYLGFLRNLESYSSSADYSVTEHIDLFGGYEAKVDARM
jgi:hypothetical protein